MVGVYFVVCTHCVICLLHEGRLGADQCDQDTRLASLVGKSKEKIQIRIVESMMIRSYALNILLIVSTKPPESSPASTTMQINHRRQHLHIRYAPHVITSKRGLHLQTSTEKFYTFVLNFLTCEFCL